MSSSNVVFVMGVRIEWLFIESNRGKDENLQGQGKSLGTYSCTVLMWFRLRLDIMTELNNVSGFPKVLGAIDGTLEPHQNKNAYMSATKGSTPSMQLRLQIYSVKFFVVSRWHVFSDLILFFKKMLQLWWRGAYTVAVALPHFS